MSNNIRGRRIDTIFVLIVFGIFAFSVLMVLMLGAGIYRNMTEISQEGQSERTVLSYVRTKVKNYDSADNIHVGHFGGLPALNIDEKYGDTVYRTSIYHYDGWLCELFSDVSLSFKPGDGMQIARVDSLAFNELDNGLLKVTAGRWELLLSLRGSSDIPRGGTPE